MEQVDVPEIIPLSPSRASDFKACPQLYKFRVVDRMPEPFDPYGFLGSLVHAVLENLHTLPGELRTEERARELISETWNALSGDEHAAQLMPPEDERARFETEAAVLIHNYFRIEDPSEVRTHETEWWVEHETEKALLRGIIDRVEVTAEGDWILVDYKTGRSPSETYALGSFFGLKFYALVCWRAFGKLPRELRLIHLKEPVVVTLKPNEQMIRAFERQIEALGEAIRRALVTGDWRPRPGSLCNWCPHQTICPAFSQIDVQQSARAAG